MKVTITAPFGRVQVEVDAWEAVTLMTRAVQAAGEQVRLSAEEQPAAADDTVQPAAPERADTEECCARDGSAESESGGTEQAAGADPADPQGNDHSVGVPGTALQRGGSDRETKDFGADEAELFRPEQPEKKAPEGETENYRGFLYIRCGKCGKIKGFCAKKPLRDYSCTCGGKTRLAGLRAMTVRCGCCEKVFGYHTNMTEEQFTVSCLGCGAPVEVELHSRTGEYVTF